MWVENFDIPKGQLDFPFANDWTPHPFNRDSRATTPSHQKAPVKVVQASNQFPSGHIQPGSALEGRPTSS